MDTVTINVSDVDSAHRNALSQVLGRELNDGDRLFISVSVAPPQANSENPPETSLPDWCNVFAGLTDDEVADLEKSILQPVILRRADG